MKKTTFLLDRWHRRAISLLDNPLSSRMIVDHHLVADIYRNNGLRPPAVSIEPERNATLVSGLNEFRLRHHSSPHGRRAYRLHIPASSARGPRPLTIMLHGCTQNSADFALGTRMNQLAEENGVLVAYPEQARAANLSLCWNWFEPADQARGSGEPAILTSIVAEIMLKHDVDRQRVFVAGLSAGGAMAAILGATYPELFCAVGVHSGLPYLAASNVSSALRVMRTGRNDCVVSPKVPTIVFHGADDKVVHPENGGVTARLTQASEASIERATENSRDYVRTTVPGLGANPAVEHWSVGHLSHAWSGGDPKGSYTDALGPDASKEMMRFFLDVSKRS